MKTKPLNKTKQKLFFVLPLILLFIGLQPITAQNNTSGEVFTVVETVPTFPGGDIAMAEFISNNIVYPKIAIENGVQGVAYISFVVTSEGKITTVGVLKETYDLSVINNNAALSADEKSSLVTTCTRYLNSAAIDVVNAMPDWTPGEQDGKAVNVQFNLPIKFALK
jgi:Gram-negative bacterial TonB protein C-terminal